MSYTWWIFYGAGAVAMIVAVALGIYFRQRIGQGWQAARPRIREHLTLAEISLVISILVFIAAPATAHIESLLMFCGGLSNLVAIIDISRQNLLTSSFRKLRIVLSLQLLFLGIVIGADVSRLINNHDWQMGISFGVAFVSTLIIASVDRPDYIKLGWLTFALILSLAVHTTPEMIENIAKNPFAQVIPPYVSLRLHAWAHLLFIPFVYLVGDFFLRREIETSRSFFPIDILLAGGGILGAFMAARFKDPSADALIAAILMIVGNCLYISWVHRARKEMRDRVSAEVTYWNRWSEVLWHRNEGLWIRRNGQDHFYREQVVIPTLVEEIKGANQQFRTLIDLGSGDGYTTNRLLEELEKVGIRIGSVFLVDRSTVQLEIASALPLLRNARFIDKDLIEDNWADAVMTSESPRVFLSVFVLQEVPRVDIFFSIMSRVIDPTDVCLAILVDPEYSDRLYRDSTIRVAEENGDQDTEWEWAGEYPITIDEDNKIYLPHFQRRINIYQQIAARNGLSMTVSRSLIVQDTPQAREIFGHTVYGQGIIGVSSSILLTIRKMS